MPKKAFRLWLGALLLAAGWSTALAAPSAPWPVEAVPCCHLAGQTGHAPEPGGCGCPAETPCQMQAAPLNPDAFALLPASAGLTPPLFSLAARLADSPPRLAKAAASDARTKPPGRLFILHAPLLI